MGVGHTPPMEPPHKLQPVTARVPVEIKGGSKPAWIVLDPADKIAEITEANNEVAVQAVK